MLDNTVRVVVCTSDVLETGLSSALAFRALKGLLSLWCEWFGARPCPRRIIIVETGKAVSLLSALVLLQNWLL